MFAGDKHATKIADVRGVMKIKCTKFSKLAKQTLSESKGFISFSQ